SLLSRWKIFDNLRRSLVAPALLAMLVTGWTLWPSLAPWFSLAGFLVLGFPLLAQLIVGLRSWPANASSGEHARMLLADLRRAAWQTVFLIAVLPHKALLMADAVARSLMRMEITRRRLLE